MFIEQLFYIPSSMIWPLVACLVLTGIHVYLGVHVIARKVIFVDLALAQIAALGTVTGVLLGYEVGKDIMPLYLYSLAFTIFGAFIFSVTRMRGEKVPHEAIIGIVYAVTFAVTILVLSRSALGPQELDHIIKGELLWVQGPTVIKTAIIYALVGLFHFIFRKKFMAISFDVAKAEASGINVQFWDFLFYMSFGFVITSSVAIAGVFLVFSYLVIPSVGGMLFSDRLGVRLTTGWIGGAIISFIGVKLSWQTGLPTSPLIVCIFAIALILSGMIRYLRLSPNKLIAIRNLGAAGLVIALFLGVVFFSRKSEEDPLEHTIHMLTSPLGTDRVAGILNLAEHLDKKNEWMPLLIQKVRDQDADVRKTAITYLAKLEEKSAIQTIDSALDDNSDDVKSAAISAVKTLGSYEDSKKLVILAQKEDDPELQISLLEGAIGLGNQDAIPLFINIIEQGGIFADDAFDKLHGHLRFEFERNETGKIRQWWESHKSNLKWDQSTKTFSAK
jgi:zinc/manganese transport system permease protein